MSFTPPPHIPNFNPGNGSRLTTDRYDFEAHLEGTNPPYATNFRHNATQIDLSPDLVIVGSPATTVQRALELLNGVVSPPSVNPATNTSLGIIQLAGDLGGNNTATSPRVSGLQGFPVNALTPTLNYVLTWNGSSWGPAPSNVSVTLNGDVTGPTSSNSVIRINGATVPAAGALVTGNILQVNGISSVTYGPLNLAGGSNTVINILPVSNLPNLLGDITGTITSNTVSKLQGYTLNLTPGPTSGQVLSWNGSAWVADSAGSGVTFASDLAGSNSSNQWISSLSGSGGSGSPISVNAAILRWANNISPSFAQVTQTSDTTVNNFSVKAQAAFASAVTNVNGGDLILSGGDPASGGSGGNVRFQTSAADRVIISDGAITSNVGSFSFIEPTFPFMAQQSKTSDAATHSFQISAQNAYGSAVTNVKGGALFLRGGNGVGSASNAGDVLISGGNLRWQIGGSDEVVIASSGITSNLGSISFSETTLPFISELPRTTDAPAHNFQVAAQNAFSSAVTNVKGGNLIIRSGNGNGDFTTNGDVSISGNAVNINTNAHVINNWRTTAGSPITSNNFQYVPINLRTIGNDAVQFYSITLDAHQGAYLEFWMVGRCVLTEGPIWTAVDQTQGAHCYASVYYTGSGNASIKSFGKYTQDNQSGNNDGVSFSTITSSTNTVNFYLNASGSEETLLQVDWQVLAFIVYI